MSAGKGHAGAKMNEVKFDLHKRAPGNSCSPAAIITSFEMLNDCMDQIETVLLHFSEDEIEALKHHSGVVSKITSISLNTAERNCIAKRRDHLKCLLELSEANLAMLHRIPAPQTKIPTYSHRWRSYPWAH